MCGGQARLYPIPTLGVSLEDQPSSGSMLCCLLHGGATYVNIW